jgi:hypothetical protein
VRPRHHYFPIDTSALLPDLRVSILRNRDTRVRHQLVTPPFPPAKKFFCGWVGRTNKQKLFFAAGALHKKIFFGSGQGQVSTSCSLKNILFCHHARFTKKIGRASTSSLFFRLTRQRYFQIYTSALLPDLRVSILRNRDTRVRHQLVTPPFAPEKKFFLQMGRPDKQTRNFFFCGRCVAQKNFFLGLDRVVVGDGAPVQHRLNAVRNRCTTVQTARK